jgi:hypothetical protein
MNSKHEFIVATRGIFISWGELEKYMGHSYGIGQSLRVVEVELSLAAGQTMSIKIAFGKPTPKIEALIQQASLQSSSRN